VIGNAHYAYIEVSKAIVAARRSERLVFLAPEDLLAVRDPNPSTEEHVLRHLENEEALEDAANHVSDRVRRDATRDNARVQLRGGRGAVVPRHDENTEG
jgi:hypothetical protein